MQKTILITISFFVFFCGLSQTKKEQISDLSFKIDSLNSLLTIQHKKNDSLINILNQNKIQIDELKKSKEVLAAEIINSNENSKALLKKNKELEEAITLLNSKLSLSNKSTDKMKIAEINKINFNVSFPYMEDTSLLFTLNNEEYELKILRKIVDEANTSIDTSDEYFSLNNNVNVCILKNGQIEYYFEPEANFYTSSLLTKTTSNKLILTLNYSAGGSGSQTTVYSLSKNEEKIELNYVLDCTEMDFKLFSKDSKQIIVFEAIWAENESHFDLHKYQIKLYNEVDGNYESNVIGTTKSRYDFDEMGLDEQNILRLLKQKEPILFNNIDLSKFL